MICEFVSDIPVRNNFETDHERGEIVLVLLCLQLQVFQVQATISKGFDGHNLQACHHSGLHRIRISDRHAYSSEASTHGGVSSMCADGNKAHVAIALSAGLMVRPDDRQTGILARCTGVRL